MTAYDPGTSVTVQDPDSPYHGQSGVVLYMRGDGRYMVEFKYMKETVALRPGVMINSKNFKSTG